MKYSLSCDFGYDVTSPIPSVEPIHSNSHCLVPAVIGTKAELFPGERDEIAEFVSCITDEDGQTVGIKVRIGPSAKAIKFRRFMGLPDDPGWEADLICGKELFLEDDHYENGKNTHTYRRLILLEQNGGPS